MNDIIVNFLIAGGICTVLIMCSVWVFYEVMRMVWRWLRRHEHQPRVAIQIGILAVFFCHAVAVWLYGIAYWLLIEQCAFGELNGFIDGIFDSGFLLDYVYFSVVTYSSLGFGDIYPTGPIRLIAGVEAINGLILIGWSVTYTYFATERYLAHERQAKLKKGDHD